MNPSISASWTMWISRNLLGGANTLQGSGRDSRRIRDGGRAHRGPEKVSGDRHSCPVFQHVRRHREFGEGGEGAAGQYGLYCAPPLERSTDLWNADRAESSLEWGQEWGQACLIASW